LLSVLRESHAPVHRSRLDIAWGIEEQRTRCLDGLLDDKLAVALADEMFALP